MNLHGIASRIASKRTAMDENEIRRVIQSYTSQGYQLIEGLFDDRSSNVYKIIAVSRNPDAWEPYRAPRHLDKSDSIALFYFLDEELTYQNMAGEMIYVEPDPEDYEPEEDLPEVNTDIWAPADLDQVVSHITGSRERKAIESRLSELFFKTGPANRWTDLRSD